MGATNIVQTFWTDASEVEKGGHSRRAQTRLKLELGKRIFGPTAKPSRRTLLGKQLYEERK